MRLLINASTSTHGGAIQVSTWFVEECFNREIDCFFILSQQVFDELVFVGVNIPTDSFFITEESPSRSKKQRKKIKEIETKVKPDKVYTIFGPAYVKFQAYHVMGFANGWITHSTFSSCFRTFRFRPVPYLKLFLSFLYKFKWLRAADEWVFETQTARNGFVRRLFVSLGKTNIVGNSCSSSFLEKPVPDVKNEIFNVLYFTADYPHKAIVKIPYYAYELYKIRNKIDFVFTVTIDEKSKTAKYISAVAYDLGVLNALNIIGKVTVNDAVDVVDSASLMLQVSYLETFSANYPEAMARKKPLVVSDFDFAHDICGSAAEYVDPDKVASVAKKINQLMENPTQIDNLVSHGSSVFLDMPTPLKRFSMYHDILFKRL